MEVTRYVYIRKENPWFMDGNIDIKKHITVINEYALDEFKDTDGYAKELFQHNYFVYHVKHGNVTLCIKFQTYWTPGDLDNIPLTPVDKILMNRSVACIYVESKSPLLNKLARIVVDGDGICEMETKIVDKDQLIDVLYNDSIENI